MRAIEITDVCLLQADLYAGAVFMKQSMGWDIWGSVIALLVLAMIFTVAGKTCSCLNCYCFLLENLCIIESNSNTCNIRLL